MASSFQALRLVGINALLAILYFGLAKLGLLLALPPGFVTAVWPPAGVAFAACLLYGGRAVWPGILLGSMLANASVGGSFNLNFVAVAIATGSTVQALVGEYALRRVDPELNLNQPATVGRFVMVTLLTCLIAAGAGNLTLYLAGYVKADGIPLSVFTWWFGDTLGVLLFLPLSLIVADPRLLWKRRRLPMGVPLLAVFLLSGLVYQVTRSEEEKRLQEEFVQQVAPLVRNFTRFDEVSKNSLHGLATMVGIAGTPTAEAYATYSQTLMADNPFFNSVNWFPLVHRDEKEKHIAEWAATTGRTVTIQALQGHHFRNDGWMAPGVLIEPLDQNNNAAAVGRDLMSEPVRYQAIQKARLSGQIAVTDKLKLLQDPDGPGGILLIAPVRSTAGAVTGFVLASVNLRKLLSPLQDMKNLSWRLQDMSNGSVIHQTLSTVPDMGIGSFIDARGVYWKQSIQLANREWNIVLHKPHTALVSRSIPLASVVLFLALVISACLVMFSLVISANAERIRALVSERTRELRQTQLELENTNQELQIRSEQAEQASLAKSRFLATMSHEIRTPLNGVLGMAQLLAMPDIDEAERIDFADTIIQSGNNLLALINDILDLSKVESGKMELNLGPVDPAALVSEVVTLFAEPARHKNIRMEGHFEREPEMPDRYRGDALRLRQMLSNLVSNAIKFTSPGGHIDITVARGKPGHLRFMVCDNGIGISKESLSRLFQRFSQVDDSATRRFGGSGLGLSIVRHLALLMEGDVSVDSTEGVGSTFAFEVRLDEMPQG